MERLEGGKNVRHFTTVVKTQPFPDQIVVPNFVVEGLLRPLDAFQTENYTENFVQAVFNVLKLPKPSIVVGGLGNDNSNQTLEKIVRVAAGNGIDNVYTGNGGGMSGPVMSYLVVKYSCWGFLIHNSCYRLGRKDDPNFGIDLVAPSGRPVDADLLNDILLETQALTEYRIVTTIDNLLLSRSSNMLFKVDHFNLIVTVVDSVTEYTKIIESLFDFQRINGLLSGSSYFRPFRVVIDCNNGAMGPYAKRIFEEELGARDGTVINHEPLNQATTYDPSTIGRTSFARLMQGSVNDLGASLDGTGGRCAVYGRRGFPIAPGETSAIVVSHFHAIPDFQAHKVAGVGRYYSTLSAIDRVARRLNLNLVETPDNLAYLADCVERKEILLWEDDNFGIGSRHVPVKDGIWTILVWLTLVIHFHKPVVDILFELWDAHSRVFQTTYEFQNVPALDISRIFADLARTDVGSSRSFGADRFEIVEAGGFKFNYKTAHEENGEQPVRVIVEPEGRIIYRPNVVSEFGSVQIIVEVVSRNELKIPHKVEITHNLYQLALSLTNICEITNKNKPDLVF